MRLAKMLCNTRRIFTIKTLWMLANLVCTAILTVQLGHVLEGYIKPTITRTWEEKVLLQDIDFPVVIKICVVPGLNQTALWEVGYNDTWSYFLGQSKFNSSVFGWAGHAEDSGTIGTVGEIMAHVSDYKIENVFKRVFVWTKDGEDIDIHLEHLKASRLNYPNTCRSLVLSSIPELEGKRIKQLFLFIGQLGNHSINIYFNGDTLDLTGRNIREHSFQSTGDAIKLKQNTQGSRAYMVDISQRVFVEEDPTNICRDYPNQEYLSYQDCDDQFVRNLLPGLTPVWLTEDPAKVSTHVLEKKYGTYGEGKVQYKKTKAKTVSVWSDQHTHPCRNYC